MDSVKRSMKLILVSCLTIICFLIIGSINTEANIQQMKIYKEAFPGSKPNCISCHTVKLPKKNEGMHDLNAYGLKVKEVDATVSAGSYQAVGTIEDFEEQGQDTASEMDEGDDADMKEVEIKGSSGKMDSDMGDKNKGSGTEEMKAE